ncbi:MAG: SDR family oxidoreductase [Deltaproteobacteria bacterium]|nr:SDR family oxidoreductase [Deltaproteobacteria bacterium]
MARRALVTGAAVRVGRAIAVELARGGFDVVVHHYGSAGEAEETLEACEVAGMEAFAVQADLADPEGCRDLAEAVASRWDSLDLLVNNASIYEPRPFEEIALDEWDRMQAINTRAPFLLSQALLPLLRAAASSGEGALVVHMCDIGGDRPVRGYTHYAVSKAALAMLVKAMAVELAPAVRSVGIAPGHVQWPESFDERTRERLARRIPMGRVGTPEDVARLVRFLALEAPYVNGDIIKVDGGLGSRY